MYNMSEWAKFPHTPPTPNHSIPSPKPCTDCLRQGFDAVQLSPFTEHVKGHQWWVRHTEMQETNRLRWLPPPCGRSPRLANTYIILVAAVASMRGISPCPSASTLAVEPRWSFAALWRRAGQQVLGLQA